MNAQHHTDRHEAHTWTGRVKHADGLILLAVLAAGAVAFLVVGLFTL